jgi:hypothetical protein
MPSLAPFGQTFYICSVIDSMLDLLVGWFYGVYRHFKQYFFYIVVVNFIGGVNQSTQRKLPISRLYILGNPWLVTLRTLH